MKRYCLLVFLIIPVLLHSQGVSIYAVSRQTGITFNSISSTGTAVPSWRGGSNLGDNRSFPVPIGFSFYYLGTNYTTVNISLNGFIDFSSNAATGINQFPFGFDNSYFTQPAPNGTLLAIAPFYEDLMCAVGWSLFSSVKYQTSGSAGNRVFTVEWINMTYPIIPYTQLVNFQVKLYEATSDIEFIYGNMGASGIPLSYTCGINAASLTSPPGNTELLTQQTANTSSFSYIPQNALSVVPASMSRILFQGCILPAPAGPIVGLSGVCEGSEGLIYSISPLPNTTLYNWLLPPGFVFAGGVFSNTIYINAGPGASSGNITVFGSNACGIGTSSSLPVTVHSKPLPTIAGPTTVCAGKSGNIYTTEAGMSNYQWVVSTGGIIQSGSGTNTVSVKWDSVGSRTISVNYSNSPNCFASTPTLYTVNVVPKPVPVIYGSDSVCVNSTNTYSTEAGMTGYQWSVSPGGVTVSGGTTTSNYITINWSIIGNRSVSVSYTNGNGCVPLTPTILPVLVSSVPSPQLFGPSTACVQSTNNIYSTQQGMVNYTWAVSAGGTITSATDSSAIIVAWNTTGNKHVIVNYTTSSGCTGAIPDTLQVLVQSRPTPSITGPVVVCAGTGGHVYSTQQGKTGYQWSLSGGGVIISGSGTNIITVTWDTAGSRQVMVNYTDSTGCSALNPVALPVTVNPQPIPTISGPATVCKGVPGNQYFTESGMTNYIWNVSAGNTIQSGGTSIDNFIVVTWNSLATQSVTVNYTNFNGCTAQMATSSTVVVNPLQVPTITGPDTVCINSTGNAYGTETGMSSYTWSVSAGGAITSGAGTHTITVTWNQVGLQSVYVNYNDSNSCAAAAPTVYNVLVEPLPVPVITGPASACKESTGNTYTTEAGMTNYQWVVSGGGSITAGGSDSVNSVTVTWNTVGAQTVSVGYTNALGCTSAPLTVYSVTVQPPPIPTVTGEITACINGGDYTYTTETGMTGYVWTASPSGSITSGAGTFQVEVTWLGTGSQWVGVNYINANGCSAPQATTLTVDVDGVPGQAGAITGSDTICGISTGVSYTTAPVANANAYNWTVPPGAIITSGAGTISILVDYPVTATSGNIIVTASNACGNGAPSPSLPISVTQIPATPVITQSGTVLTSNMPTGNQWFKNGILIPGATGFSYLVLANGEYWDQVIINGCGSDTSNHINVVITGLDDHTGALISLFPNPNNGRFTLELSGVNKSSEVYVEIYTMRGESMLKETFIGESRHEFNLEGSPSGIYILRVFSNDMAKTVKIIKN